MNRRNFFKSLLATAAAITSTSLLAGNTPKSAQSTERSVFGTLTQQDLLEALAELRVHYPTNRIVYGGSVTRHTTSHTCCNDKFVLRMDTSGYTITRDSTIYVRDIIKV